MSNCEAMKLVQTHRLIDSGASTTHELALGEITQAISELHWPIDASAFAIYPESGKKRSEGNGVRPIRE